MIRGEETQIFGALASEPSLGAAGGALIGLPGTHAKWAFVGNDRIERFYTFMTGETFGVLRDHTILGRTIHSGAARDESAFIRGVETARDAGHPGLLATIFSTRTLGLTGQLTAQQQPDYLSGLLIGHELRGLNEVLARELSTLARKTLRLIGNEALCDLRVPEEVAVVGFDDIAVAAHVDPPLTTVLQPMQQLGETAAELLLKRLRDPRADVPGVLLPHRLVRRRSA